MATSVEIKTWSRTTHLNWLKQRKWDIPFFLRPYAVSEWKYQSEATFPPWKEDLCVCTHHHPVLPVSFTLLERPQRRAYLIRTYK